MAIHNLETEDLAKSMTGIKVVPFDGNSFKTKNIDSIESSMVLFGLELITQLPVGLKSVQAAHEMNILKEKALSLLKELEGSYEGVFKIVTD